MSKPVSPLAIGSFTIGAVLLLIIGIAVFGGGKLFNSDKIRYVIFFDSSLNGLEIGAPVKMQGVKIGEVTEISLLVDPNSAQIYKPVVIDINRNSLAKTDNSPIKGGSYTEQVAERDKLVKGGFRARLEMQSLLTGLLYVDFDIYPGKPPVYAGLDYKGLVELPGIPTTTDEIRNVAEEVMQKLRDMPVEQMVQDFSNSLKEIQRFLASEDLKESRVLFKNTLVSMEKTMHTLNRNLDRLLTNTDRTMVNTNALVVDLHQELIPVLASINEAVATANQTLNTTQASMAHLGDAVGPESAFSDTMQSLNEATRSVKNLADYLERHPESLLSGKQ